ncbi:hypothetical protein CEXT_87031 [Caerostris extrusa]|uniref:Uncharacterized protein n=1 Tax=Caerostris extrusa TaxID=172846 RepID=A0AAV4T336_CAEEX|nr:hypothetical protein CEXT_87031 [Caerostris extrusa]
MKCEREREQLPAYPQKVSQIEQKNNDSGHFEKNINRRFGWKPKNQKLIQTTLFLPCPKVTPYRLVELFIARVAFQRMQFLKN